MNRVRDLVTQRSGKLISVFYEIKERVDDVHVAAWGCELVGLFFMNRVELERVDVSRLGRASPYQINPGHQNRIEALEQHFRKNPSVFAKFNPDPKSASVFVLPKDAPEVLLH